MGAVEEPEIPWLFPVIRNYISNVERKMGKILLRKTLMLWNAYLRRNGILFTETLDNHVLNLNVLPMWKQMFKEIDMFTYLNITQCVHKPKHPITASFKQAQVWFLPANSKKIKGKDEKDKTITIRGLIDP